MNNIFINLNNIISSEVLSKLDIDRAFFVKALLSKTLDNVKLNSISGITLFNQFSSVSRWKLYDFIGYINDIKYYFIFMNLEFVHFRKYLEYLFSLRINFKNVKIIYSFKNIFKTIELQKILNPCFHEQLRILIDNFESDSSYLQKNSLEVNDDNEKSRENILIKNNIHFEKSQSLNSLFSPEIFYDVKSSKTISRLKYNNEESEIKLTSENKIQAIFKKIANEYDAQGWVHKPKIKDKHNQNKLSKELRAEREYEKTLSLINKSLQVQSQIFYVMDNLYKSFFDFFESIFFEWNFRIRQSYNMEDLKIFAEALEYEREQFPNQEFIIDDFYEIVHDFSFLEFDSDIKLQLIPYEERYQFELFIDYLNHCWNSGLNKICSKAVSKIKKNWFNVSSIK